MIESAGELRIDPQILLKMNFSDAVIYLKAAAEKEKNDYKISLALAYKTALWSRCNPKDFPKLEKLLEEFDQEVEKANNNGKQTPQQMFEIVKMLNAKFGGN